MGKSNKQVVAISNKNLFRKLYFQGFSPTKDKDYWKRICEDYFLINRREADKDEELKQPVILLLIYSPKQKKLFYFRPKEKPKKEETCEGKWSCGVYGHIKKIEGKCNELHDLVYNFFDKKFTTSGNRYIRPIGYINYEKTDFGKTHFGIIFLATFDGKLTPLCPTLRTSGMIGIKEISNLIDEGIHIDKWTKVIFPEIRKFLGN